MPCKLFEQLIIYNHDSLSGSLIVYEIQCMPNIRYIAANLIYDLARAYEPPKTDIFHFQIAKETLLCLKRTSKIVHEIFVKITKLYHFPVKLYSI